MSIFDQIRKTAQSAAREGLELLGLNLSHVTVPDDEDTKSRNFFDIYRDIVENSRESNCLVPVPEPMCAELREYMEARCGNNAEVRTSVEAWIADRRSFYKKVNSFDAFELENAYEELNGILVQAGMIQTVPRDLTGWLKTAQAIAAAQLVHIRNLLVQACRQVLADMDVDVRNIEGGDGEYEPDIESASQDDSAFEHWCCEMNCRLVRFGYQLEVIKNGNPSDTAVKMCMKSVPVVSPDGIRDDGGLYD